MSAEPDDAPRELTDDLESTGGADTGISAQRSTAPREPGRPGEFTGGPGELTRAARAERDRARGGIRGSGLEPGAGARRGLISGALAVGREVGLVLGLALVLSFVVKTWFVQAFFIPSGSMEDTLGVGDRVVVSKLTPGPLDLSRGDVVVFEDPGDWLAAPPRTEQGGLRGAVGETLRFVGLLPSESENHLIKRVVGLPGDRVVCCDGERRLVVNEVPVDEPYLKPGDDPSSLTFDITVPEGRLWVMGDHRSDSEDSRFHDPPGDGSGGSVPIDRVTGRAVAVVWPLERMSWLSDYPATFTEVRGPRTAP
ncbi:MAG: signal peptidase I [Dermatophilaceae bacterium]